MVPKRRRSSPLVLIYVLSLCLSCCQGQAIEGANGGWQQKALFTTIFRRARGQRLTGRPQGSFQRDSGATCQPVVFVLVDPASNCLTTFAADLPRLGDFSLLLQPRSSGNRAASDAVSDTPLLLASQATVLPSPARPASPTPSPSPTMSYATITPVAAAVVQSLLRREAAYSLILRGTSSSPPPDPPRTLVLQGPLLPLSSSAPLLPALLLPPSLLLSNPSLYSSLSLSFSLSASASFNLSLHGSQLPPSNSSSLDVASAVNSFASALPAAIQAMQAGTGPHTTASAASPPTASAAAAAASPPALRSTTLGSFLTALLPALPAQVRRLPGVCSGELVTAGLAALTATTIAYIGFLPAMDSPRVLAALAAAMDELLRVNGAPVVVG